MRTFWSIYKNVYVLFQVVNLVSNIFLCVLNSEHNQKPGNKKWATWIDLKSEWIADFK